MPHRATRCRRKVAGGAARLVAVAGPSVAGKDMLIAMACAARPDLRLARRVITRSAGAGDFMVATEAQFRQQCRCGDFALHWQAPWAELRHPPCQPAGAGTMLVNLSRGVVAQA